MDILGPDFLVFGVDDIEGCSQYLRDFGLARVGHPDDGAGDDGDRDAHVFEALDGTGVILRRRDDPALPPPLGTATMLRQQIYGVRDAAALDAIAVELGKDRAVTRAADGAVDSIDDHGFALRFQVTVRRALDLPGERINSPGSAPQRAPNERGVDDAMAALPRTLSHVVLFVPDIAVAAQFYTGRLGFRVTDTLTGAGPFLQPGASDDHHTLFFINTPPHMQGCEHFAFHMGGPTELMLAGTRFVDKGYQSFWGPGRHKFGSNWFWYFNSPLGCHVEYDADMDKHDADWKPRTLEASAENSQLFLFEARTKWFPSGPPPGAR